VFNDPDFIRQNTKPYLAKFQRSSILQIKRTKPEDAKTERFLLTAIIISENVCRTLSTMYDQKYFQSPITKTVSQWCFDYFIKYDVAIQKEIQSHFEMKSKAGEIDPDLEEQVEKFLSSISDEYEEWENFNEQYYIDLGREYFKKRSYDILSEQIKSAVQENDVDMAEKSYSNFIAVRETTSTASDILEEDTVEELKISYESKPPAMFKLPGALGNMVGTIERETFVGILGREKIGKTYYLMIWAMAALRKGLNVAFLETGDLTKDQLNMRLYSWFTKKTARSNQAGDYNIPVADCLHNQTGECPESTVDSPIVTWDEKKGGYAFCIDINDPDDLETHIPCTKCKKDRSLYKHYKGSIWWQKQYIDCWTWPEAKKALHKFKKWHKKGRLVTDAFPMESMKASDIRNWCLNKQKMEGFIPDVLIVDYPDILLPENDTGEFRHNEGRKWKILRKISQEFHNSVIVPTQADTDSYSRDTLSLKNFSEDKSKYAHVTHFYALNQTNVEKDAGILRVSSLLLRENHIQVSAQVSILQSLVNSRPYLDSFYGRIPSF